MVKNPVKRLKQGNSRKEKIKKKGEKTPKK